LGEPGAPATTGAPVGARTASTTATLKGTQAIASGYPADIAGTVTSASGAPLSEATVVIQVLAAGATAWRKVATEKTASTGAFAAVVTPSRNSRYRAVFAGTATDPAVTSPSIKVSVVPVISLKASARRVVLGGTLTFTGVLKPRSAAATVMLQCRRGTRWLEAGSAKVLSNGAYRVRLKVTSSKAGRCRTAVAASSRYASGRSREAAYSMR
ncbi:MAG: hypothetical protein JWP18_2391, partial [Solirubrobacterales bacterium]|nr:hypothetical protein [Solirubrobacterales bacterium]